LLRGDGEAARLNLNTVAAELRAFKRECTRRYDARGAACGEDGLDIGDVTASAIAPAKVERCVGRKAAGRERYADIKASGF
jgi:hypothetical protein